ncbi:hypothetical protein GO685_05095 [Wolbachia endosymbiont of Madathamugadia hiepei]|nr:hypothetical protein [Wolbachia endosymbiont of Madathamugadia hiepei]
MAALTGNKDIVITLLEKKADVNAKDNNEDTPVHRAAEEGYIEIVRAF